MSAYISVQLQREIRARFTNCCAYCLTAELLTATTFEFDHILPRSLGGETALGNLCLACPSCNRYKADRQNIVVSEDSALENPVTVRSVPLFHPQLQVWNEHFSWNEDASEIISITDIGRVTINTLKMNRPQLVRVRKLWVKLLEHPPKIDKF
jgi:HNH endonuclease